MFDRYPNGDTFRRPVQYQGDDAVRQMPKSRLERKSVTSSVIGKAVRPEGIVVAAYLP